MSPLALWSADGEHPPIRDPNPIEPGTLAWTIVRTGEPTRINDWGDVEGETAAVIRDQLHIRSSVGVPIKVGDELWGAFAVHSKTNVLPPDTESRLQRFADLVVAALTNAQARAEVRRLADEQAALRRVATLVAREATPDEVFSAVAEEMARLLDADDVGLVRYDDEDGATVVGLVSRLGAGELLGRRLPIGGDNAITHVRRTGRTARVDGNLQRSGEIGDYARRSGSRSTVGGPVIVGGRLWGAIVATSGHGLLPPEAESRTVDFTELVATAIANVEARQQLAASRARLVAAADDERRRVVRDLHDGAQQRLVHTVVTLKLALQTMADVPEHAKLVTEALEQAEAATTEVRELAHGIMPAVLTRGGLRAGVVSLASRSPVPVAVDVPAARLSPAAEATGYFVVAEALTNVAKHANARHATVSARVDDEALCIEVCDDGVGGARAEGGGLIGLHDRVTAHGGTLEIDRPAGGGTRVRAQIPLAVSASSAS